MNRPSLDPQEHVNAYEKLLNQLSNSQNQINEQQGRLLATQNAVQTRSSNLPPRSPKIWKADLFKGKGSVISWI